MEIEKVEVDMQGKGRDEEREGEDREIGTATYADARV